MDWYGAEIQSGHITIGIFDGVHKGHQMLLAHAASLGSPVVALTFDPHPALVVAPEKVPSFLLPLEKRIEKLRHFGAASVAVIKFSQEIATMSPQEFIDEVLVKKLDAQSVTIGNNFSFGAEAKGNADFLKEHSHFPVFALPIEGAFNSPISSSRIRRAIVEGNIDIANELLNSYHQLSGPVIHGEKRGRAIGYPTANVDVSLGATIPSDGVYVGWLSVEQERWPAAISIGTNPTFAGKRARQVEAYALDQEGLELYGKEATIEFGWRLRDTIKFEGLEALLDQMKIDCEKARELTTDYA
jgi:riboflavin kinase/FMN adenylyltransferase